MSTNAAELERLLREAVAKAKEAAPHAVDDLIRCASEAGRAVAGVTGGAAALEIVPVEQLEDASPTYQLQLRKVGSEAPPSDLGIYRVSEAGYPVLRWYSRPRWERNPEKPDGQQRTTGELEGHFKWLLSDGESGLVRLVLFVQQQPALGKEASTETKQKGKK